MFARIQDGTLLYIYYLNISVPVRSSGVHVICHSGILNGACVILGTRRKGVYIFETLFGVKFTCDM